MSASCGDHDIHDTVSTSQMRISRRERIHTFRPCSHCPNLHTRCWKQRKSNKKRALRLWWDREVSWRTTIVIHGAENANGSRQQLASRPAAPYWGPRGVRLNPTRGSNVTGTERIASGMRPAQKMSCKAGPQTDECKTGGGTFARGSTIRAKHAWRGDGR